MSPRLPSCTRSSSGSPDDWYRLAIDTTSRRFDWMNRCRASRPASTSAVSRARSPRAGRVVPVCPETMGGLPTPRPAAEIQADGRVATADGADVTDHYERGARASVELAVAVGAREAVLKERSPSCGCHQVYNGSFSRARMPGEGVTARALRQAGVEVRSEEDVSDI